MCFVCQANNELQRPTNTTGTCLDHVNEYCLLGIFEVDSLSWMDLCSVAETCKRFQRISQRVFPKDLCVRGGNGYCDVSSRKYLHNKNRAAQTVERIFKNFGSRLTEVSVSPKYRHEKPSNNLLNLVAEYCGEDLKSLTIRGLNIPASLTVKLNEIFKRLQLLDLRNVSVVHGTKVFADLNSMIELRVENSDAILANIFTKLESFTYRSDAPLKRSMPKFIRTHPDLKTLNLGTRVNSADDNANILKVILQHCTELKELILDIGSIRASSLQKLQALKSLNILKLSGVNCYDFEFLSAMRELRELHLFVCHLPGDLKQFTFLAQLNTLHIQGGRMSGAVDVVGMINVLINLKELTVAGMWKTFVLTEGTFHKIVGVVTGRPHVLTLKCNFNFVLNVKSGGENRKVKLLTPDRLID